MRIYIHIYICLIQIYFPDSQIYFPEWSLNEQFSSEVFFFLWQKLRPFAVYKIRRLTATFVIGLTRGSAPFGTMGSNWGPFLAPLSTILRWYTRGVSGMALKWAPMTSKGVIVSCRNSRINFSKKWLRRGVARLKNKPPLNIFIFYKKNKRRIQTRHCNPGTLTLFHGEFCQRTA